MPLQQVGMSHILSPLVNPIIDRMAFLRSQAAAWLSELDFEDTQRQAFSKRVPGTSDWILRDPTFNKWIEERSQSPVLWCHGLAGTGKTVATAP